MAPSLCAVQLCLENNKASEVRPQGLCSGYGLLSLCSIITLLNDDLLWVEESTCKRSPTEHNNRHLSPLPHMPCSFIVEKQYLCSKKYRPNRSHGGNDIYLPCSALPRKHYIFMPMYDVFAFLYCYFNIIFFRRSKIRVMTVYMDVIITYSHKRTKG